MKSANEWSEELTKVNSESWRCGSLTNAVSLAQIFQIQLDAYQQGQKDTMAWVSRECKRVTERHQSQEVERLIKLWDANSSIAA